MQLSHNVLIFGLFQRANLYYVPRVTVFSSDPKNCTRYTKAHLLSNPIGGTQFGAL